MTKESPQEIFKYNLIFVFLLLALNLLLFVGAEMLEVQFSKRWQFLFDFDSERNVPTIYSGVSLFFCSLLLHQIYSKSRKSNRPQRAWLFLSIIFLFLSFDEIFEIHERLMVLVKLRFEVSGFFHFAWVIPYGLGLIVLGILFLKFLYELPKKIQKLFICSGLVFVLGALGLEMISGKFISLNNDYSSPIFFVLTTIEEFLEMTGIVIFIYALLRYQVEYQAEDLQPKSLI